MQVATALEKTGRDFWQWVEEIENSELFKKLHQPAQNLRVITINTIRNYYIPRTPDGKNLNPSSIRAVFKDNPVLYNLFINMGWSRFYYYFIEKQGTTAERTEPLREPYRDIEVIESSICKLLEPTGILDSLGENSPCFHTGEQEVVAEVFFPERQVLISHTYPQQRYIIDDDKLYNMITDGHLLSAEVKEFYHLRRKLESVNLRFSLVNRVVEQAIQHQKVFLAKGDEEKLQALEELHIADSLDVDPSWISRIVKNKCLIVQHRLVCLKDLFISNRNLNKKKGIGLLRHILTRQNQRMKEHKIFRPYSDEELRLQFLNEFDFKVSRRSINNWKRELERENDHGTNEHMG